MSQTWYCFSRPEEDGHEYVCADTPDIHWYQLPVANRNAHLYCEDGVVIVFDRDQVREIQAGMHPQEACRLRRRPPGELEPAKSVKRSGRRFEKKAPAKAADKPKPKRKRTTKKKE